VVGANALGLINRGFDTYVAPSMGDSLSDTPCESCGMCISTCPTGAISENVLFKPGPVKTEEARTICNYCSIGCSITLNHRKGFVMGVSGDKGVVNKDGSICGMARFGYKYLNDRTRITKPLLKTEEGFKEISFDEAVSVMAGKIRSVEPDRNGFFAGARLTNEEMYLVQKLARAAVGTGNLASFQYINRGDGYRLNTRLNTPLEQIAEAGRIYLIGSEINRDHPVAGFWVSNTRFVKKVPVTLVTTKEKSSMEHKADEVIHILSYYFFFKALNHYILANKLQNSLFLKDRVDHVEEYVTEVLASDYNALLERSGASGDLVARFAEQYNLEQNAIIISSEQEISGNASVELYNLAMITGKLGKTASGLVFLKESANSHGIHDMGISRLFGPGSIHMDDPAFREKLISFWNVPSLPGSVSICLKYFLAQEKIDNLFIFGEDPVGCAMEPTFPEYIRQVPFIVVQDAFMTETAKLANLVLPASFPAETGGTLSNTQKVIQQVEAVLPGMVEKSNLEQFAMLLEAMGMKGPADPQGVLAEYVKILPEENQEKLMLVNTTDDNLNRIFDFGCDCLMKRIKEEINL
jgi:formate dehydrogenase major subunit